MGFVLYVWRSRLFGVLRSPSARNDSNFCMVHSDGDSNDYDANYENGVSLGFCGRYYFMEYRES